MSEREHNISKPDRLLYADVIRGCALFLVVTIHVSAPLLTKFSSANAQQWWMGNVFDSISNPAVPLFIMISGLLLLDPARIETLNVFFKKRFIRVLVPFLLWSSVYFLWRLHVHHENLSYMKIFSELLGGRAYFHLWFIYMLLGLYLATPILRIYVRCASIRNQMYFIALWLIVTVVLPAFKRDFDITVGIDFVVTTRFVGFFVLGHFLRGVYIPRKRVGLLILLVFGLVVANILTVLFTYAFTSANNGTNDFFLFSSFAANTVCATVCLFLLLQSFPWSISAEKCRFLRKGITLLSSTAYTTYLMHPLVLEILRKGYLRFSLSGTTWHPLLSVPLTTLATLLICTLVATLLRRIPYVGKVLGG